MKTKIHHVLVLACLSGFNALAQMPQEKKHHQDNMEKQMAKPPEQRAKEESEKAEKKLSLTSDQKSKWEQAALTRISANKPLVEKLQGSTTPEERSSLKSDIKKNGKAFDQTVNAMLTPEQKTKWEGWKAEKKKHMQQKMKEKKMAEDEFED
jgi:periplasmic protein CpxP/Spy